MRIKRFKHATITEIIEQSQSVFSNDFLKEAEYKIKLRDQLNQRTLSLLETDELQHISDILDTLERLHSSHPAPRDSEHP